MTDARQSRCPVTGCGVWKNALTKRGGSSRRWYRVDSNRHLLLGQLDEALVALPYNDHICPNCYKHIRSTPPPPPDLLDELTAAADQQPPSPPAAPSPSDSSPSMPPQPQPPQLPPQQQQQQQHHQPPPTASPPPISPAVRRVLSDISSRANSPRKHSTSIKRKQQLIRTLSTATTAEEKLDASRQLGIPDELRHCYLRRYKAVTAKTARADKENKRPQTAKRQKGAGRRRVLTTQQDTELYYWIFELRRCNARFAVSEKMLRMEAKRRFSIPASSKWCSV